MGSKLFLGPIFLSLGGRPRGEPSKFVLGIDKVIAIEIDHLP
jgi:hypothetical protein